jgi:hypothetical protein
MIKSKGVRVYESDPIYYRSLTDTHPIVRIRKTRPHSLLLRKPQPPGTTYELAKTVQPTGATSPGISTGHGKSVSVKNNDRCPLLKRRLTMVSKLSKRIEELELRLKQREGTEHNISYKAVLELTSFVHELSRKIDYQQEGTTVHS